MRRMLMGLAVAVIGALFLASGVSPTQEHAFFRAAREVPTGSRIQHVVVIYQENHTFDEVLGKLCETRPVPCNGYTGPVTLADGVTARNNVEPDIPPFVAHDPTSQTLGMSNQWDRIAGCTRAPYTCITHVNPANIPNLVALANTFTVSDATFAAGMSASFGAHVTLAAGTIDGFAGLNPSPSTTGAAPRAGWGCPSHLDALWGPPGAQTYVPSCIPNSAGAGPYRPSPVPYVPTVMQRLEAAGLTWHIYQGASAAAPSMSSVAVCTYFSWCLQNRFTPAYDSASQAFLSAAHHGTLPNLSLLLPTGSVSQHNGASMTVGDNYIGSMVHAVEHSPQWASTAIFITYDDCGCFYDHVTPPSGLGLRNPMVIVSPWAKRGYTDSTTAVQPYSMLAFIEDTFGLAPLTSAVSRAYDYSNSFDFSQRSVHGPRMSASPVSRSERAHVARLRPQVRNDPT